VAAADGVLAALAPGATAEEVVLRVLVLSVLVLDVDTAGVLPVDEVAAAVGEVVVAAEEVTLGEVPVTGAVAVAFAAEVGTAAVGAVCPGAVALGVAPGAKGVAPVKAPDSVVPDVDDTEFATGCCSVCASTA
jgi:hypothetical protein